MKIDLYDCFDNHLSYDVSEFKIRTSGDTLFLHLRLNPYGDYIVFPFGRFYKIFVDDLVLKRDDYHLSKQDFAFVVSTFHDGLLTFNKKYPCLDNKCLLSDLENLLDDLYLSISMDFNKVDKHD